MSQPGLELHFVVLQEEKQILANYLGGFAKVKGILWWVWSFPPTQKHNLIKVGVTKMPNVCEFCELSS